MEVTQNRRTSPPPGIVPATSNLQNKEEREFLRNTEGSSALYGTRVSIPTRETVDVAVLHENEILDALQVALDVYQDELTKSGYTPLTINSYSSAINRFINFLELGRVVPDFDNKPTHNQ